MRTPKILRVSEEAEICHFRSAINYTVLHLENGKTYVSGYNIKVFEKLLSGDFIKVNRSDLVNISYVKSVFFKENSYYFLLHNGKEVSISRRRIRNVKEKCPNLFKL